MDGLEPVDGHFKGIKRERLRMGINRKEEHSIPHCLHVSSYRSLTTASIYTQGLVVR